jgi:hypothetical protein
MSMLVLRNESSSANTAKAEWGSAAGQERCCVHGGMKIKELVASGANDE